MEFFEGTTLKGMIAKRGGKLPLNEAARVLQQVAEALAFIHVQFLWLILPFALVMATIACWSRADFKSFNSRRALSICCCDFLFAVMSARMAMYWLGDAAYLKAFRPEQLQAMALLSLKYYTYGGALFTAYYGVAWIVRSYLIFRSGYLPKLIGVLVGIGGLGFVVRNFLFVLAPAYASDVLLMLFFPGGLLLMGWLLVRGVNVAKWNETASGRSAA